jgi:RNA polymerase sigma factor (sigma-70 family)
MRDDPFVADLVTRARKGDQQAWDDLVERYSPLIWSICRHYRLSRADAEDVAQRTWLQFVNHLGAIRDPAAVPGWLTTTAKRECGRVVRAVRGPQAAGQLLDESIADRQATTAEQELLAAERHAALHQAFTCLSPSRQQLMAMLIEDPPVPYTEISARLGIPVSSIGPTRRRCLDQIRHHPAIAALINGEDGTAA